MYCVFFFKQKTAYEMRISDWSSDVCSSDLAIFHKWELDFAVIGRVTDTGHMVLRHKGEIVCDIPLGPLADNAPKYDRPHVPTPKRAPLGEVPAKGGEIGRAHV